jgi:hypothetical protein
MVSGTVSMDAVRHCQHSTRPAAKAEELVNMLVLGERRVQWVAKRTIHEAEPVRIFELRRPPGLLR